MNTAEQLCCSLLSKCKTLRTVKQIHGLACKTGLATDPLVFGKAPPPLRGHNFRRLEYARRLFLHFPNPDAFMYNTLLRGLAESDTPHNALVLFAEMRRKSTYPLDSFSFAFVLKAAANCRSLRDGMQLPCQALTHGLHTHLFVGTTLISVHAECGRMNFARKVFEEMSEPNVVARNAMLTACFRCGDVESVEEVFDRMPLRDLTLWNIVLAGYMKADELELAKKAFLRMPVKDDVSWCTMIVGFAQNGCFDEAFGFFRELQRKGIRPNEASLTAVLSACAQAGAVEFGKTVHGLVEKAGFLSMISVNNSLLDT